MLEVDSPMGVLVALYARVRRPAVVACLAALLSITALACRPAVPAPVAGIALGATPTAAASRALDPAGSAPDHPTPDATLLPKAGSAAAPTAVPTEVSEGVNVGQRAPDFALPGLYGPQIRLSDLRGKVVLINFWATWCPPCREEMPALNDLYRQRRDEGFVVLAVNFGEDPETVAAFVKKGGYDFPVVLDRDSKVGLSYQAIALPTSYLVDAQGIVRDRIVGAMPAEVMQAKVGRFIGAGTQSEPKPSSVVQAAGAANEQVVAALGEEQITMGDVNHRLDVLLVLDRIETGAVLDPLRPADQEELKQRQRYALGDLIDQRLLADAARAAKLKPDSSAVEHALVSISEEAGGSDALAAELAEHGVTVDDVRALLEEQSLAGNFVDESIVPDADAASTQSAVSRWLDDERSRRGVKILQDLGG